MPCAKWLALPLCAALLLCGCAAPAARPSSAVAEEPPAASVSPAVESLKMALLLDGPIDDGGWNADCHAGLTQARDILGYTVATEENLAPQDFEAAFRRYAEASYQLIIAPGGQYESTVAAIYQEYPGSHFAGINFTLTAANVTALNFNNVQAGFLAGAMAGLLTRTGSVGYIGGDEIPSTIDALRGMGQGIKYVRDNVQYTASTIGAWDDPAKARALAEEQMASQNVDVIFANGDIGNTGVVAATQGKASCILMDSMDMLATGPDTVCCTIVASNSAMVMFAATLLADGQIGATVIGDIANGVVRLGAFGAGVDAATQDALAQICQDIIAGNIIPA